ncbi:SDR family NAD(P)-dependent oxidoreductase [Levilactobacillus acidifarinae]|uniref:Oxidoreductase, short chain dehydrogenase reductase family protein n=1 Tax=Levilactobacillus acidifarinae DSM 19394 = JCM 15949 TaxID=1423715 RepID=A0A0R1LUC7_9LACO|nr:SDR family oxidoreductase [Levilactobacillus acidifarinae]KRK95111.1 oxidoreductase, short chain dehydrogenase reductase family protein [Levilactobacillus acidifarinae DSM 19394]GEO70832.1 short-chain dehydrogenase [Levilactobacillus acidifarinae]
MKTLIILGAGPGLGLSLAKTFGHHDYQVALVARNPTTLAHLGTTLASQNIQYHVYSTDVTDPLALRRTLTQIVRDLGEVSVVEFSPYAGPQFFRDVQSMTPADVQQQFDLNVLPAVQLVQTLLPTLQKSPDPAILFNSGISAIYPLPQLGNTGIAVAGLRNYAQNLHQILEPQGIYVGFLAIATQIAPGTPGDPDKIAAKWYQMVQDRTTFEAIFPAEAAQQFNQL